MIRITPRADLQTPANPAKLFCRIHAGLITAHHAFRGWPCTLHAQDLPSALDDLGGNDRFGLHWKSSLHLLLHYTAPRRAAGELAVRTHGAAARQVRRDPVLCGVSVGAE